MQIAMFPGQGSQFPGMGKELFARYPHWCDVAEKVLDYSITALCQDTQRINMTTFTQPAIFFVSCLVWLQRTEQEKFQPQLLVGHSLGLYAALFAAGAFDLATGLRLVAKRGELMREVTGGAMTAVIGECVGQLAEYLLEHHFHDVDIANFNSSTQAVISGKAARVESAIQVLEQRGLYCSPLPVSGAFHSRYMEPARIKFAEFLQEQTFAPLQIPVVSSTSGQHLHTSHLLEEMAFQLTRPVRWVQTIRVLLARHGGDVVFEEVGPGQVLTRLIEQVR